MDKDEWLMSIETHWTQWLFGVHWTTGKVAKLIKEYRLFLCLGPISIQFKLGDA